MKDQVSTKYTPDYKTATAKSFEKYVFLVLCFQDVFLHAFTGTLKKKLHTSTPTGVT